MTTKTISIMEDAYRILLNRKMAGESFSDVIRREFDKKRDIMKFAGAWKNVNDNNIKKLKKDIEKMRKDSTKILLKKYKR